MRRRGDRLLSGGIALVLLLCMAACSTEEKVETDPWQEQYDLGVRYLSDGNYEEAILAFTAAIEIDAKQVQAYTGRGEAYVGAARLAADGQTDPELLPEEAVSAYENAVADYLEAIGLDPDTADWYSAAADVYEALGRLEDAVGILTQGAEATGDQTLSDRIEELQEQMQPEIDEAAVYTDYLVSGSGWEDILGPDGADYYDVNADTTEISSCLADVDEDGIQELLVYLTFTEFAGPGGYETFSAVLDIDGETAAVRQTANYGGGTGGGDYLEIWNDTQENRPVVVFNGYMRDSVDYVESYFYVFDNTLQEHSCELRAYNIGEMLGLFDDVINEIKGKTDVYAEEGGMFHAFEVNGTFETEEEYNAAKARYVQTDDPALQLQSVTASAPVPPQS